MDNDKKVEDFLRTKKNGSDDTSEKTMVTELLKIELRTSPEDDKEITKEPDTFSYVNELETVESADKNEDREVETPWKMEKGSLCVTENKEDY